jgi:hypothetical protein
MKELIFSLKDVFNAETSSGCLSQYEASCYHIPAYQRGYKWCSEPGGPVPVLLPDLLSAFEKKESECYLQYITVKRILTFLSWTAKTFSTYMGRLESVPSFGNSTLKRSRL